MYAPVGMRAVTPSVVISMATILVADYDKEVALKRALKVTQQSTFVVFKDGHEVARSTGQTREQDIKDTFAKAL